MKIILLSSIVGLTLPLLANEAKLFRVSASTERTDNGRKLPSYNKLTFLIEGKDLIHFDKKSLVADGWKLHMSSRVCKDGTQASFTISKKGDFVDKISTLKVAGSITLISAEKTETVTATATTTEEQNLGPYAIHLLIEKNAWGGNGVTVKGDIENIKKVTVKQDGKVLKSDGTRPLKKQHIRYRFKGIKDGAQVSIEYWVDTKKVTYKFSK